MKHAYKMCLKHASCLFLQRNYKKEALISVKMLAVFDLNKIGSNHHHSFFTHDTTISPAVLQQY